MNTKKTSKPDKTSAPWFKRAIRMLFYGWIRAYEDVLQIMRTDYRARHPNPLLAMVSFIIPAGIFWWIYVPIHEFFHVFGCLASGGTIEELEIDKLYGGAFFAKIFPFVKADSDYSGRLSGFDPGSDIGYLITDFAPYILSVLFGVWLLRIALKRESLILLGPGVILGFTPLYNLLGDYYEMGSIVATRIAKLATSAPVHWEALQKLRSDDLIKLIKTLSDSAANFQFGMVTSLIIIAVGCVFGILFAGWTYHASDLWYSFVKSLINRKNHSQNSSTDQ